MTREEELEIGYCYQKEFQIQLDNKFVDTERFSPVIYGGDLPDERDPFHIPIEEWNEEELLKAGKLDFIDAAWWHKQRERCLHGYTVTNARENGDSVTISGRHYFYLNFWLIYAKKKNGRSKAKKLTSPRFTDLDFEEFWVMETMFQLDKDNEWLKARQKGFSEKIAGGGMGYNYTFVEDSQNIIVGGNDGDSKHTMGNAIRGLDVLINTQFYKERSKDANDHIKAKYFGSQIVQLTAGSRGDQSVSRFTPYFIVYEEVGKWAKGLVRATREFVDASLMNEGEKTGWAVYIGTGGDMEGGAADLEKMYANPSESNLLEFEDINELPHMRKDTNVARFVPAWKYAKVDSEGNSLYQESLNFHEREAKKRSKDARTLYYVNHPMHASQAFMVPSGGYFGDKLQGKLIDRRNLIQSKKRLQIVEHGNLKFINPSKWSDGVVFIPGPDEKGKTIIHITERPKVNPNTREVYENLYKQTTDSYDRDEANASASLGSSVVGHGFLDAESDSNYIVARITVRPEEFEGGARAFFLEVLKLNIYYNAINLIEYSNLRIFDFYKDNGFSYLLKERPNLMISRWIKDSKVNNQFGIDPSSKPFWLSELADLLKLNDCDFIEKTYDTEILLALSKFKYNPGHGRYNCDITICMGLLAVLFEDEKELEVIKHTNTNRAETIGVTYKRKGNYFNQTV